MLVAAHQTAQAEVRGWAGPAPLDPKQVITADQRHQGEAGLTIGRGQANECVVAQGVNSPWMLN